MAVVRPEDPVGQRWRDARGEWREVRADVGEIASGIGRVAAGDAQLAVAEVRDGIRATAQTAVFGLIASVLAVVTLAWLPLPLVLGLAEAMPLWAASLVTVGCMALVALLFVVITLTRFRGISLMPREALKRVKEDKEWVKQQLFESSN